MLPNQDVKVGDRVIMRCKCCNGAEGTVKQILEGGVIVNRDDKASVNDGLPWENFEIIK